MCVCGAAAAVGDVAQTSSHPSSPAASSSSSRGDPEAFPRSTSDMQHLQRVLGLPAGLSQSGGGLGAAAQRRPAGFKYPALDNPALRRADIPL